MLDDIVVLPCLSFGQCRELALHILWTQRLHSALSDGKQKASIPAVYSAMVQLFIISSTAIASYSQVEAPISSFLYVWMMKMQRSRDASGDIIPIMYRSANATVSEPRSWRLLMIRSGIVKTLGRLLAEQRERSGRKGRGGRTREVGRNVDGRGDGQGDSVYPWRAMPLLA